MKCLDVQVNKNKYVIWCYSGLKDTFKKKQACLTPTEAIQREKNTWKHITINNRTHYTMENKQKSQLLLK